MGIEAGTQHGVAQVLRWREPALVVVAVALVLRLVLAGVAVLTAPGGDPAGAGEPGAVEPGAVELVLFVVLFALALSCHLGPPTRHARALTALALVLGAVALVIAVLLAVGATRPTDALDVAGRVLALVLPALAVAALVPLLGGPAADRLALGTGADEDRDTGAAAPAAIAAEEGRPDPAQQPVWRPEEAAGAAWYSAGDAASGRPAAGWGSSADTGWQPVAPPPGASLQHAPDQTRPGAGPAEDRPVAPEPTSGPVHPWSSEGP